MGLLLWAAAGCSDTGPAGPVPSSQRQGLIYTADLIDAGPETLFATVTVANRGLVARTIRFPDPCVSLFRFHDVADRLVWDQHPSNKTCVPPAVDVTLQPGESRTFERFAYAPAILAFYRIPTGRYRIILYMRPDGVELELELGEVLLERPPPFQEGL
jgi:hypothetical protein